MGTMAGWETRRAKAAATEKAQRLVSDELAELREAVRELLASDGGDGRYDGSRFTAARERCRKLAAEPSVAK